MSGQPWGSEWFELADMDFSAAEYLLGMRPLPVEIICYHCEQAVEKLLKGVLVHLDLEPPKTHDLIQLCKLCGRMDERFDGLADACAELTPYGVQIRYPSELELNEADVHNALSACKAVNAFVREYLNRDIVQDRQEEQTDSGLEMKEKKI